MSRSSRKNRVTPKTQEDILNDLGRESYITGDPIKVQEQNRGQHISREDDNTKDFKVTLEDVDTAVITYIKNTIKPTILQNGNQIKIPTIFSNQEIWKSIQADGYFRDQKGKLQIPIIILKRESIEKNRNLTNKLDGNKTRNYDIWAKKYNKNNQYDKFSLLNNRTPNPEYYAISVPDFVTIKYSVMIWTNYMIHMNKIIESFSHADYSYWGEKNKFQFKTIISSFPISSEMEVGKERIIKSELSLDLQGYLLTDTYNKYMSTVANRFFDKTTVKISGEREINGNIILGDS